MSKITLFCRIWYEKGTDWRDQKTPYNPYSHNTHVHPSFHCSNIHLLCWMGSLSDLVLNFWTIPPQMLAPCCSFYPKYRRGVEESINIVIVSFSCKFVVFCQNLVPFINFVGIPTTTFRLLVLGMNEFKHSIVFGVLSRLQCEFQTCQWEEMNIKGLLMLLPGLPMDIIRIIAIEHMCDLYNNNKSRRK